MAIDTPVSVAPQVKRLEGGTDTSGKFEIEPLEPGFGITLGNTLRRVLLSSLWGAAVTSIQIVGVNDLTDAKTLAHLLKFDSVHKILDVDIQASDGEISVGGKSFRVSAERDPSALPWRSMRNT